jgi:osmotically-inducible protein OsmY
MLKAIPSNVQKHFYFTHKTIWRKWNLMVSPMQLCLLIGWGCVFAVTACVSSDPIVDSSIDNTQLSGTDIPVAEESQAQTVQENTRLEEVILATLADSPEVMATDIQVQAVGGTVTLRGTTDSWTGVSRAGAITRSVPGVKRVANLLQGPGPLSLEQSDAAIKVAIENAFDQDDLLADDTIEVTVSDGQVILNGNVDNLAEKKHAAYQAWVSGVTDVDSSGLNVIP